MDTDTLIIIQMIARGEYDEDLLAINRAVKARAQQMEKEKEAEYWRNVEVSTISAHVLASKDPTRALFESLRRAKEYERHDILGALPAEAGLAILDDANAISAGIRERRGKALEERAGFGTEANGKLKALIGMTKQLEEYLDATKTQEIIDHLAAVRRSVYTDCLDMDPATIRL